MGGEGVGVEARPLRAGPERWGLRPQAGQGRLLGDSPFLGSSCLGFLSLWTPHCHLPWTLQGLFRVVRTRVMPERPTLVTSSSLDNICKALVSK